MKLTDTNPMTLSFTQRGDQRNDAAIASTQIKKAMLDEVTALSEAEKANFRLAKATEMMKSAEIAYQDALAKSAWNREELRKTHSESVARFRDADKKAVVANEELAKRREMVLTLRAIAKGETVAKREFSQEKREALAEKGHALPDGSFPIETVADLKNAISSIGRAGKVGSDRYNEVKAHIVEQADRLGASDELPEDWKSTPEVRKEIQMDKVLIVCPSCMGENSGECPWCDNGMVTPDQFDGAYNDAHGYGEEAQEDDSTGFTTKALLTRSFEKSVSYQDYIFEKGGPGSGAQPGHPFYGNQHTGGMREHPRLGIRRGWKDTVKTYTEQAAHNKTAAEAHKAMARFHEQAGRFGRAAEEMRKAADAHKAAAGHHEGIASTHQKEAARGSRGADASLHPENRIEAARQRVYAQRAADEAARLEAMAA